MESSNNRDFTPTFSPVAGLSGDQLTLATDFYESANYQNVEEAHENFEDPLFPSLLQSGYLDPTLLNVQNEIDNIPAPVRGPNRVLDRTSASISQLSDLAQANPTLDDFDNIMESHGVSTDQGPESGASRQGCDDSRDDESLGCGWVNCKQKGHFQRDAELRQHIKNVHVHPQSDPCPMGGCYDGCNNTGFRCGWDNCKHKGQFQREAELWRHIKHIHVHPKSFQCPAEGCTRLFNRKDNMNAHLRTKH